MIKKVLKILSIVILVFLFLLVCVFLFGKIQIPYDMIEGGITCVKDEKGYNAFEWSMPKRMKFTGRISKPVVDDSDNSLKYHYWFIEAHASRWDIWFNSVYERDMYHKVSDDGWDPARDKATTIRYLAVYYLNPDGTAVLLWEHPDAEEIIERTGTELLPPTEYLYERPNRR